MKLHTSLILTTLCLIAASMSLTVPPIPAIVDIAVGQPVISPHSLQARYAECAFSGTVRETCIRGKQQTSYTIEFNSQKYTMDVEPGKMYFQGLQFLWYPPVPADRRGNMFFNSPTCNFWENNDKPKPPQPCGSCRRTWWSGNPLNCGTAKEDGRSRVRVASRYASGRRVTLRVKKH
jgi:hypothetical protein